MQSCAAYPVQGPTVQAQGRVQLYRWALFLRLQGRQLSRTGDKQDSLGDVERPKKPVNTELAFSAEGKLLSCRFYVSDGLVHELPPSAKEVRPKECSALLAVRLQQFWKT